MDRLRGPSVLMFLLPRISSMEWGVNLVGPGWNTGRQQGREEEERRRGRGGRERYSWCWSMFIGYGEDRVKTTVIALRSVCLLSANFQPLWYQDCSVRLVPATTLAMRQ